MNVLGDCFGVGIVQHFSRKDLDKANGGVTPTNTQPASPETSTDSAPSIAESNQRLSPTADYGTSHFPPLPETPNTARWSNSTRSQESAGKPQVYMSGVGLSIEAEELQPDVQSRDKNEDISSAL